MFENALSAEAVQEALEILQHEFPLALWETVYVTLLSTAFAIVLGLPLGILLVAGEPQGVLPLPKWLMRALNILINLLRSVPFLILMILLIPLTRAIVAHRWALWPPSSPWWQPPSPLWPAWQRAACES